VIHNPGTIPDNGLLNPGPDVTTVLEESYKNFQSTSGALEVKLASLQYDRRKCSYIVHSVPRDIIKELVQQLRRRAEYVFVTDLCENYYERFGPSWVEFIEAMQME
jgi:hypothetical protein